MAIGLQAPSSSPTVALSEFLERPGSQIGRYRLLSVLGEGGMGIVYLAEQREPVKREVALKVIKPGMDSQRVIARFEAEQQALALMEHPHIARVYDAGLAPSGRPFFVMEYVRGIPITEHCDKYRLQIDERLRLFLHVCAAVQHAHHKGIIHRDLKPSNILVVIQDEEMIPKVIDFGVARAISQPLTERTLYTEQGQLIGTPEYMSPEQADLSNQDIDTRTDIYSLGIVLYELLTGVLPFDPKAFRGGSIDHIRKIICEDDPKTPSTQLARTSMEESTESARRRQTDLRTLRRRLQGDLDWITLKALDKDRIRRYQTAHALAEDIERHLNNEPVSAGRPGTLYRFQKLVRRNKVVLNAAAVVLTVLGVVALLAAGYVHREARIRRAREELLPKIDRLIEGGRDNYVEAYKLATEAQKYLPRDPRLSEWVSKTTIQFSILTEPPGAKVFMREYKTPESQWEYLGVSPIEKKRFPLGFFRWKMEKEGYETTLAAACTFEQTADGTLVPKNLVRSLDKTGTVPPGMVRVPGQDDIGDFLIDRYEVTNRQFKEFVTKGGYQKRQYWRNEFVKDGEPLTWEDAVREFVDATGKPGPATWKAGDIPEGQEDYPVCGVSWHEAAAYGEFVGRSLPTVTHWGIAKSEISDALLTRGFYPLLAKMSNFDGMGPAPVGTHAGMTGYGTYDMAGNVREWCWNETPNGRVVRGGAWNDATYMFLNRSQALPFDRSPKNGFRCVLLLEPEKVPKSCFEPLKPAEYPNFYRLQPVPDPVFQVYREQFSYDKTELADAFEWKKDSSRDWTQEKISFNAAYDNERVIAYLFLPKRGVPPYQTVIYFPGSSSKAQTLSTNLDTHGQVTGSLLPLVKSGRAVLYPVYKGTFERGGGEPQPNMDTYQYTEYFVKVVKDFRRCVDYLQTRRDIHGQKLAYFGFSWGGRYGAIIPAVEERLAASVLRVGGLSEVGRPEVNAINYVGRVRLPTLMLNGRYDLDFPYELTVKPMFDLLGTPPDQKELKLYDADHGLPDEEVVKETLAWLDRYLGPVK